MKKNWRYLSYPLSPETPAYAGGQGFFTRPDKQMATGDSCNTQIWEMPNHIGTHVDVPRHFSEAGSTIDAYPADFWVFDHPWILDISPVAPEILITPEHLDLSKVSHETDILLLRTGFFRFRGQDEYWRYSPGVSPDIADMLRQRLPSVRAIGFDLISVSSLAHREIGRKAHQAFLDHAQPILLIEDMDLSFGNPDDFFSKIIVAPLQVEGSDGSLCTVLGKMSEKLKPDAIYTNEGI